MSVRQVRKRDGRLVPFDKAKIRAAVAAAQEAGGERDLQFAAEVADVVSLALARRLEDLPEERRVPSIEEIQDLVERALIELGAAPIAKAYILYRDQRARARGALELSDDAFPNDAFPHGAITGGQPAGHAPSVQAVGELSGWSKGRIVAALMNEADLPRTSAQEVAARVESRVFESGLRRITPALIRALVDDELAERGLTRALARQRALGLPRHDLRELLARSGPPADLARAGVDAPPGTLAGDRIFSASVQDELAGSLLRRYALEDVLDEASAERERSGQLSFEDLERPHLYLNLALPSELLARGEPGPQAAYEVLGELASLFGSVSRGIVLEESARLLAPLTRARAAGLANWLTSLAALARASGRRLDLAAFGAREGPFLARLFEALASLERDGAQALPRLFLERTEAEAAVEQGATGDLEHLLGAGLAVPVWGVSNERVVGPGCHRRARERGAVVCASAAGLNLLRAAHDAGPWREDRMCEQLVELVGAALDGLLALQAFQRAHRSARSGEVRGRIVYALTPVGLGEALQYLGDGEIRPTQGARLLGVLADATRRLALERQLAAVVTPFFGGRAAARFAQAGPARPALAQGSLFAGELERSGASTLGGRPLPSPGFRLPALGGLPGQAEARLFATLPAGALFDLMRSAKSDPLGPVRGATHPALEAWLRFEEVRRRALEPRGAQAQDADAHADLFLDPSAVSSAALPAQLASAPWSPRVPAPERGPALFSGSEERADPHSESTSGLQAGSQQATLPLSTPDASRPPTA